MILQRGPFKRRIAFKFTAACLCAALLGAMRVAARHHDRSSGEPGNFDFYLLSLSWSPAFCLSQPESAECNGPRRFGFIVHGLWPQYERGWPRDCGVRAPVPDTVVEEIADLMPARGLVYHEWKAHGTCSGLNPTDFFAEVRKAYGEIRIPAPLSAPMNPIEQPPSAVGEAFLRANPQLPRGSVVIICSSQDVARLREVHICLDRQLAPRVCSADAAREACRAPTVLIPPVR
jgi:ribonuclease T2